MLHVPYLSSLTLNLLTAAIVAPPNNASEWEMGFNLAFKGLNCIMVFFGDTMNCLLRMMSSFTDP